MVLSVQIISLIVSFCYGFFFCFILELSSKFIYSRNLIIRIFYSFLFILLNSLFYFLILIKINYGYVHVYFFICMLVGYLLCKVVYKKIVKRDKL